MVLFALQPSESFDPCADHPPEAPCRGSVPLATSNPNPYPNPNPNPEPNPNPNPNQVPLATSMGATLSALPTFVFSFTCHQNIISVTNDDSYLYTEDRTSL